MKKNIVKIVILFMILGLTSTLSISLYNKTNSDKTIELKEAIQKASVECYAVEGMYPPSVEYLEENYGIQIDRNKYNVFYNGFASNMIPDITIVEVEKDER